MIRDGVSVTLLTIDLVTQQYETFKMTAKEFIKSFKLPEGRMYDIGMDQSNTCTGIGIKSMDGEVISVMEVINWGVEFKFYRNALLSILDTILRGAQIRYFIMEEPLGYMTGRRNRYLTDLKNLLVKYFDNREEKNVKKFERTPPQTWRSGLIGKDNPHPKNSKEACVHEILFLYPLVKHLVPHVKPSTNKADYDGYEALGILEGFLKKHEISNDSEVVKILGPKNGVKSALAFFTYEDSRLEEFGELVRFIRGHHPKLPDPSIKYYNEDATLYENVKMSLVDDFTVASVVTEIDVIAACNLFNLVIKDEFVLNMIVVPNSLIKSSFLKSIEGSGIHYERFY